MKTFRNSEMSGKRLFPLVLLLLAAGAMVRCDNTVEPFDSQQGFYSIYGLLDLYSEENVIRVKDLNTPLLADSTRELNVTVRFENLDTGEEEVLTDSVVRFDGVYTHNFPVTLDMLPDNTYRVTVEDPEGGESFAVAKTPQFVDVGVPPPTVNCTTEVEVTFEPVLPDEDLAVMAGFEYQDEGFHGGEIIKVLVHEVPDQNTDSVVNINFEIQSLLRRASERSDLSPRPECYQMNTDRLFLEYTHYSADFFGQNESDTTHIPGGTGRFGALYRDTLSFEMDTIRICPSACHPPETPDDYCECFF